MCLTNYYSKPTIYACLSSGFYQFINRPSVDFLAQWLTQFDLCRQASYNKVFQQHLENNVPKINQLLNVFIYNERYLSLSSQYLRDGKQWHQYQSRCQSLLADLRRRKYGHISVRLHWQRFAVGIDLVISAAK